MNDNDLLRMAKAGESFAWSAIYEKHFPWLYALALKQCHGMSEAQDAVQETFVSAFLKLHQLKDPVAFPAWIRTILVRQCLKTHDADTVNSHGELAFRHWHNSFTEPREEEFNETKLHNLLATLPEVLRGVLLLRYFSDWHTYEQMAEILGIPVGTVRSRLNQAKERLLQCWRNVPTDSAGHSHTDQWNEFYTHYFSNLYFSLSSRDKFLNHLSKNLELCRGGTVAYGRHWIEQEIEGDVEHGSYFRDVHVVGSGNISVIELVTQNSKEHPDRCPAKSVIVAFRSQDKVDRLHLYHSR